MRRLSIEQRVLVVKTYYQNGESATATVRKLRPIMGRRDVPKESTVRRLMTKFEETGSLEDVKTPERSRSRRSLFNQELVFDNVLVSPQKSVRRRSQELGIPVSSMQRILKKDLRVHPYKIQLTQELKTIDHGKRREFVNWFLEMERNDTNFHRDIIFSDEAHFHMNGYVNKQNCRYWGLDNPQQIEEREMHPQRVTVWCGFWSGGIIGPFFFEDDNGNALTVNGERYRSMINERLFPVLEGMDINRMWFQQDGATCHTARQTIHLLQEKFGHRILSRNGDQNWPARSCDLTPLDFFLWGYVKSVVYENKPRNTQELKEEIGRVISEIDPEMCERVLVNFKERIYACHRARGGHMPDIVFHT